MPLSPGFSDYVHELLAGFGPVEIKRMFGGAGVYRDGVMFALIDDDVLYLKADDALAAELKTQGSVVWTYTAKADGVARDMGYWRLPETAADDPDEAAAIARKAFAVAVARKAAKKPAGKK